MIDYFKSLSIRNKLIILQLFTAFIIILLFGIYLVYSDQMSYNRTVKKQLNTIAQIISENSISAIEFLDEETAEEILNTLETQDNIVNAYIYDIKGDIFAKYSKKAYDDFIFLGLDTKNYEKKKGYMIYTKIIIRDNEELGKISLRFKLDSVWMIVMKSIIGAAVVIIIGMSIALLLSIFTQKTISKPIINLAKVARKIADTRDYSIRIEKREATRKESDEIKTLYSGIDEMLKEIHKREMQRDKAEEKLRKHKENLEETVKNRTKDLESKKDELEQANIKLLEIDQLKRMFIASMSHELRTPLNSIIGFTGIMLMGLTGELNEEQKKQLTMAKASADHLLALVNDIIDMSKIEADKAEIKIDELDITKVLKEITDSFQITVKEKGIKMPIRMPKRLKVISDKRRIQQIMMNLVSNAVKFTDEGEIEIKVTEEDGMVEVSVKDSGPGIKQEDMDRLFKTFSRIHVEGEEYKEGTGLGLHLSRKIADLLGGEITAESEFGKGSTFTLTLPLKYEEVKA